MLIITTAISGSNRKQFLQDFAALSHKKGKKVKIYNVGEMMFGHAQKIGLNMTRENILNTNPAVISSVRSAVFEGIARDLPKDLTENHAVFINIHAVFFWKKVFSRAWDSYYISQFNPDLFITLIDDSFKVKQRLDSRKQWEQSKLSLEEILLWQNVEVEMTASWAEMARKMNYVIPTKSSAELLLKLIFEPEIQTVYVSMPLTNLDRAGMRKIDRFIKRLEKYFVVFDPRNVEPLSKEILYKVDPVIYNQIVNRDLYWLIKQSQKVIVYFPEVVLSSGAVNELKEAHETNKEVWLVYPKDEPISPFLTYYSNLIFRGPKQLFKYIDEDFGRRKKKKS